MDRQQAATPLVSIIVPVYKAAASIGRCIDSVLQQTYRNFQLVLVDDGSPDNSGAICDEYAQKDTRICVVHIPNGGVSNARNTGLDHARGEYVMFVDSDDYVSPTYIEHLLPIDGEELVCGGWIGEIDGVVQEVSAPVRQTVSRQQWEADFVTYWSRGPLTSPWCKCFRRELIEKHALRFDLTIDIGEDELFDLCYLRHCRTVRYTDECDYHYCMDADGSLMKKYHSCRLLVGEKVAKAVEAVTQREEHKFRWQEWRSVLQHYEKWIKNGDSEVRKRARRMRRETYDHPYFRETIPYMRTHGSLDQKIESYFMRSGLHWLYRPIYSGIVWVAKMIRHG